jgi:hypothetical protein
MRRAVFALVLVAAAASPALAGPGPDYMQPRPAGEAVVSYGGVNEMIDRIGQDAISRFRDFFGPAMVNVEPFVLVDRYPRPAVSALGLALADQMIARINDDSVSRLPPEDDPQPQWLMGMLQEMDGYLRIHIYGVNMRGERRSFVAVVEMSEPLYRALHARVGRETMEP